MDLFAIGAVPFRNVGGRIVPEVDPSLVATRAGPGTPDYAARVQAFIQESAPDQWENLPVGFYQAFLGTVRYEDALPNGGERALLPVQPGDLGRPGQSPGARRAEPGRRAPALGARRDGLEPSSGSVTTIPLGETFKPVLTGEGSGLSGGGRGAGSQFLLQYAPGAPDGVARPGDLPNTVLAGAFAQVHGRRSTPPSYPIRTPPRRPHRRRRADAGRPPPRSRVAIGRRRPQGATRRTGGAGTGGVATTRHRRCPAAPGVPRPPAAGAVPARRAAAGRRQRPVRRCCRASGTDPCYSDEQITFSPPSRASATKC